MTDAERAAFWRGKRVLVTGGAGFLGSALCHRLAAVGARVTALDAMMEDGGANIANLDGASVLLVRGDIREMELRPLAQDVEWCSTWPRRPATWAASATRWPISRSTPSPRCG